MQNHGLKISSIHIIKQVLGHSKKVRGQKINFYILFLVFGVDPDFVREGCSIPVTLTFQELTKKNVMLLPIGACDDMAHSQNEKINISNYIEGTKALAAYLLELAHV